MDAQLIVFSEGLLSAECREAGVPVHCLGVDTLLSPSLLLKLTRFLRQHRPDAVHTHGGRANLYGRVAATLAKVPQVVTTIHSHSNLDYDSLWKNSLFAAADRLTWSLADSYIAVSGQLRNSLIARGLPESKITVIHNGIAERVSGSPDAELASLERPLLLAIGRLVGIKRFDILLRSLNIVADTGRRFTFVLVGDGPEQDSLSRLAAELNLSERVLMCGYRRDARRLLLGADLFVMSSDMEGLPVVLLEAMAAQVPVVATAVGGIPEAVTHQESALLVQPGNAGELASAIIQSLDDQDSSLRRAHNAHGWFQEHGTARAMAEKTTKIYSKERAK
jgi:glycosyltransferase involved in cell wall biosynthesis